ncbi:M14 family zinc carboxypeptidase [Robertkochia aurantiaca]|uniref:M14 family zinc carboxypeptidase n=1 Tax=Robertkochia aurantiaca TaxID=2873700 RepID=UPI001CCED7B2|nr:M14 family zinc carboxypeptidase [Robertkochia sp. 3YJGBD-33]
MKNTILLLFLCGTSLLFGQQPVGLDYYLPDDVTYNSEIPTPESIIGHEVGEWHVTHDKLVNYMKTLADASPRISITDRGSTFENRPLLLLTITSPKNHERLEEIRTNHLAIANADENIDVSDQPIVVYQGFSIHGNEPSGSNAALALAYHLAAAEGSAIESLLDEVVILFDPSFNPDGLQRFAYWANIHKSQQLNPDGNDREYHEVWPGGRTNHYWFDMNRDWLPVQLPESRARISSFYQWIPNILTDHHEMGTNSTFFFQPGEPKRVHPLTPGINQELTKAIGKFHAEALDDIGSLYYSEENYDDYYYGKGSTFPDVSGSIGILFEQGSSRGHIQESDNGILTFPFTIRNQFTTGLSTLKAAQALREDILNYQKEYYRQISEEGRKLKTKAYVFGDAKDAAKTYHLAEILKRHQIRFHQVQETISEEGETFEPGKSYIVPTNQRNYRLIEAMFEKRTTFEDSLFYDVSAWTFPLAFNLDYKGLNSLNKAGDAVENLEMPIGSVTAKSEYAYLFEWHEYYTPKALNRILNSGLRAKVGMTPFSLEGNDYDYGTIMVPVVGQDMDSDEIHALMQEVASDAHITIHGVSTGLTRGIDLGSNDFEALKPQKVAILVGEGVRSYDAGEIWHLFDTRYGMKITQIDTRYLDRVDLSEYTTFIIPSFYNGAINESSKKNLEEWVNEGGNLIGYRDATEWLSRNGFIDLEFKKHEEPLTAKNIAFEDRRNFRGAQVTGGAIFEANIDRSHPVNFGYSDSDISLFRNTNIYIQPEEQSYNNPIRYTEDPLQSGYISEENLELLKGSVPFQTSRKGRGRVSVFTDNTNFRAFWYGTNKLMMNAIFFAEMM